MSAGTCRRIRSADDEVTITSDSAFTAAEQLMYVAANAPGCSARQRAYASDGHDSSSEHPASRSGISTSAAGFRIFATSAMKRTPQKTIILAAARCASRASSRESPTKSARSWISGSW